MFLTLGSAMRERIGLLAWKLIKKPGKQSYSIYVLVLNGENYKIYLRLNLLYFLKKIEFAKTTIQFTDSNLDSIT